MGRPGLTLLAVAALALAPAATVDAATKPCTKGKCAVRKAKKQLRGKVLIRFVETGSIGTPSSLDQRLHLCRGGRFIFDTVSDIPGVSTTTTHTEGGWRVLSARFSRDGRHARARVHGTPDDGSPPLTVKVTADDGVVKVDGNPVIVQRSDQC